MLKFESWPPTQGNIHFTDSAFDTVLMNFNNQHAILATSRSLAILLRENCNDLTEAANIFADLAGELPESRVGDAENGLDEGMFWNPRQTFADAGNLVLESSAEGDRA